MSASCKHEHPVWVGTGEDRKCGFCLKEGLALALKTLQYLHDGTVLVMNCDELTSSERGTWLIIDQTVFPVLTELKNQGLV